MFELLRKNKPIHLQPGENADEALKRAIRLAQIREIAMGFSMLIASALAVIATALVFHTQKFTPFIQALVALVVLLLLFLAALSAWKPKYKGNPVSIGGVYHPYRKKK